MKKKLLAIIFMVALVCILAVVACADTVTYKDEAGNTLYTYATLNNNSASNPVVSHDEENPFAKYDSDGDALTWYVTDTVNSNNNYTFTVVAEKTKDIITVNDKGEFTFNESKFNNNLVSIAFDEDAGITTFTAMQFHRTSEVMERKFIFIHIPDSLTTMQSSVFLNATCLINCYISESSGLTDMGEGTFRGATSLKSIYIPKGVTRLRTEETNDKYWENGMFKNCFSLTEVTFAKDSQLEVIEKGTFNDCNALKSITLPNSVKKVYPRAFANCPALEYVNFGGGLTEIVREDARVDEYVSMFQNSTKLKTVILPYTLKAENLADDLHTAFSIKGITVYYSGTEADFIALQEKFAKATSGSGNYGITQATYNYINHCEAFYGGVHTEGELENYQIVCSVYNCNELLYCEHPEHSLDVKITYEKYTEAGTRALKCLTCETKETITEVPALITFKGYSKNEEGTALCVGYILNTDAIKEYKKVNTGINFEYGAVIASADKVDGNIPLTVKNNSVEAVNELVVNATINSDDYVAIDIRITGDFTSLQNHEFLMSIYIYDGSKLVYIQGTQANPSIEASEIIPVTIAAVPSK